MRGHARPIGGASANQAPGGTTASASYRSWTARPSRPGCSEALPDSQINTWTRSRNVAVDAGAPHLTDPARVTDRVPNSAATPAPGAATALLLATSRGLAASGGRDEVECDAPAGAVRAFRPRKGELSAMLGCPWWRWRACLPALQLLLRVLFVPLLNDGLDVEGLEHDRGARDAFPVGLADLLVDVLDDLPHASL